MDTPAERLGGLVKQRRESMGIYAVATAAAQAGMVWETWAKVENGGAVRAATYRKIEDVVGWEHGSCEAILDGGEPTISDARAPSATPGNDMVMVPRKALVLIRDTLAQLEQVVTDEIERSRDTDNRIITARR